MKKVFIRSFISLVAVLIFTYMGYKIYKINQTYPEPQLNIYSENQEIKGGDISLYVEKSNLVDYQELCRERPDIKEHYDEIKKDISEVEQSDKVEFLLVHLKAVNHGNEELKMQLTNFMAESDKWTNGLNQIIYRLYNNFYGMTIKIKPDEEKEITLAYILNRSQFSDADWNKKKEVSYKLILSLYPYKNIVKLNV